MIDPYLIDSIHLLLLLAAIADPAKRKKSYSAHYPHIYQSREHTELVRGKRGQSSLVKEYPDNVERDGPGVDMGLL